MGRLIVNHVKNPFDPFGSREIREFPSGLTVKECIDRLPIPSEGYDYAVCADGLLLSESADLTVCRPVASLVICAVPQGGGDGGKNPLKTIAMLVVVIVAAVATWYVGGAGGWAVGAGFTAAEAAALGAVAGMAVMMAGSLLVNALFPVNIPDITGGGSDFSQSSTYGWNVAQNSDRENVPWPVLYGTHRITPPIIGKYVEVSGDKQYLNILYALADHAIDSIDETSVEINGNAVVKGEDGVTWETRLGAINQPVIQFFNDTRVAKTIGSKLTTSWTTVQTDGNAVEGLGVAFSLPRGLFYGADDGSLVTSSVKIDLEYRILPAGEWVRLQGKNETTLVVTEPRWSGGYYGDGVWKDIEEGSENPADHLEGDIWWLIGSWLWFTGGYGEDGVYRSAQIWHWLEAAETHNKPGTQITDYKEIAAAQSSPLRRVYYRDRLPAGQYEIRARFHEAPPASTRYANDVWFDYIEEIIYDDFTYPGTSLFALRALATDKLSGGLPRLTLVATRSTVPAWTGAAYENKLANLSAWQAWDALHNEDYGAAVPYSRLPVAAFQAWADYCTTKGYHSNIYFDSLVNLRKALDMVGAIGEGAVAQMGSSFTAYVDGEVALPVQSFMFADANIIRDSYSETYLSSDDRANSVEVTFWDAANGYKRTTFEIPAADFDSTTEEIKRTQLTLPGCTSRAEAIKHGIRALNRNRYLTLTASWEAGFDAIGCLPWDPVVPPLGLGGRVVSGTAASVTIDQQVILQPGHTYIVRVKNSLNDTAEEATVAAVAEETVTDTLAITGAFIHTPLLHEMFLFYEQGEDAKMMRVLSITRKGDMTRKITAVEYSAAACDDTGTIPAPEVAVDPHWVDHLHAEEVWKGGAETRAQLSWTGFAIMWRVWYRVSGVSAAWTYAGETTKPSYEIRGLDYGPAYQFAVSHTRNPEDGKTVTITLTGKTTPPGDVGTITAVSWEDGCTFTWPKVSDFDLAGYQVRSGVHWQAGTLYAVADFYVVPTDGTARRYRCLTPGTSGASEPVWPVSGTVNDGTVVWAEASSGWNWQTIAAPAFVRELTDPEKAQQGKDNLTVRIWAAGLDAFGNVSATPATGSSSCLNQKPYISVGVTTVEGTFTDLPAAIAKLPSGGGRIVVKNGVYQMAGSVTPPDKELEIEGESQGGVVLRNHAGNTLLDLSTLTKTFSLSRLSIESTNTSFGNIIYDHSTNTTKKLRFEGLVLTLNGTSLSAGDVGIKCDGTNILEVKKCHVTGGKVGVDHGDYSTGVKNAEVSRIEGNQFSGQYYSCVQSRANSVSIIQNIMREIKRLGVELGSRWSHPIGTVSDNEFRTADVSTLYRIARLNCNHLTAVGNKFYIYGVTQINSALIVLALEPFSFPSAVYDDIVNSSIIEVECNSTYPIIGILGNCLNQGKITSNSIRINNSNAAGGSGIWLGDYGAESQSNDNILSDNSIDMVNSRAGDVGINLDYQSSNNKGSNNLTYRAGVSIRDLGTDNSVNKAGGGTF